MGQSSQGCECSADCNGVSQKNTWSKPEKQPQTSTPPIVREIAITLASRPPPASAEPVPTLPEKSEEGSTGGSVLSPPQPQAEDPPPKPVVKGVNGRFEPSAALLRFDVSVVKEAGEGYGLGHVPVEDGSNTLLIVALQEKGPIGRWNDAQQKGDEKTVQQGDRIVAASGVSDDAEAMRIKLREDSAVLTLERWPDTIVIALVKRSPTDQYGLSTERFHREDSAMVLRVTEIGEGLMMEWNRAACQSRRFHETVTCSFDIVKLDELADDPEKMQEALMTRDSVELTFRRPDPSLFHK